MIDLRWMINDECLSDGMKNLLAGGIKKRPFDLFVIPHTPLIVHQSSFIQHSSFIFDRSSFTSVISHQPSFIIQHASFIIGCSSFISHQSPVIIHHSSFIIHHSSQEQKCVCGPIALQKRYRRAAARVIFRRACL